MRQLRALLPVIAALACAALMAAAPLPLLTPYIPQAQFCFPQAASPPAASPLCSVIPGDIAPDPMLNGKVGYRGIVGANPTAPINDVETPFDNYSWQTFVALNWTRGKQAQPAADGLKADGDRVWQGWSRVSKVFGNSKVQANCPVLPGQGEVFSIASNGDGTPATRNEEYIQAATGDPAIDVSGNWTIYERRVNDTEIAYLQAPNGQAKWNLTNPFGQSKFVSDKQVVNFPAVGGASTGAMEIKAAWRVLDPKQHAINAKKYYVIRAVLAVAPDLVAAGATPAAPICAHVDLGLVALHIIQKNLDANNLLLPEWFWTTFEHVDNAPLAAKPCDITAPQGCQPYGSNICPVAALPPGADYSYYNAAAASLPTNQPPALRKADKAFVWNPVPPFAKAYLLPDGKGGQAGTQVSRCWAVYRLTQQLNAQWQSRLRAVGSVFANYMLIGTQWGAKIEPHSSAGPEDAAPNFLSNSVVETYLQKNYTPGTTPNARFGTGSCVTCHTAATLTVGNNVPANQSFLPGLVQLLQTRRPPLPPDHR